MRNVYCEILDKLGIDIANELITANLIIDEGVKKSLARVILNLMINGFIRKHIKIIKEEFENGKNDEKES